MLRNGMCTYHVHAFKGCTEPYLHLTSLVNANLILVHMEEANFLCKIFKTFQRSIEKMQDVRKRYVLDIG